MALLSLACGGCVGVPYSATSPFDEQKLHETLTGATADDVASLLGEAARTFELPGKTYHLYMGSGTRKSIFVSHPAVMAFVLYGQALGHDIGLMETSDITHCLLIEVRDNQVVRTESKRTAGSSQPLADKCLSLFWGEDELRRIEAETKNHRHQVLTARTQEGDTAAALALAAEYGDRDPLRMLAIEDGDITAALALAAQYNEREALVKLAMAGNLLAAITLARDYKQTAPLYGIAAQGNVNSAIALARYLSDEGPLMRLAQDGNREAAAALQAITCEKVYYRAGREVEFQASDNFVYVCEGDESPDWETTRVYADWGPREGVRYRRYFKMYPRRSDVTIEKLTSDATADFRAEAYCENPRGIKYVASNGGCRSPAWPISAEEYHGDGPSVDSTKRDADEQVPEI